MLDSFIVQPRVTVTCACGQDRFALVPGILRDLNEPFGVDAIDESGAEAKILLAEEPATTAAPR